MGTALPIPILPFASTVMRVEVEVPPVVEAMVNKGVLTVVCWLFEIERSEYGEVVPIPTFTAFAPVPPSTRELLAPTIAFAPIAVAFVKVLEAASAKWPKNVL
ncbi:hypothetical protein HYV30_04240 [Candidatus Kaiserbacteria bacterium]|nr:hypothetical protein [Candidatus Kaiserbacteria bacterium]